MSLPKSNQIEVSLFGPGFGECSVIHIGDGRWIIVDSCINMSTGSPIAIEYLNSIGVSPDSVEMLIATHWHDDHIRGFAELVQACQNAKVCVSNILTNEEFVASILAHDDRPQTKVSSGVKEIKRVMEFSKNKGLIRGSADRRILHIEPQQISHGHAVEVWTLSPCDESYQRFLASLGRLIPAVGIQKKRMPLIEPNECSVVILISIGPLSILLGADLEEEGERGWSAILSSPGRPQTKASFFKVPHHGSNNAHHADVWRTMLVDDPLYALAPYDRGKKLPALADVKRMVALAPRGYSTAPVSQRTLKRTGTVGKILTDFNMKVEPISGAIGHVRGRSSDPNSGAFEEIELFNGALPLRDVR